MWLCSVGVTKVVALDMGRAPEAVGGMKEVRTTMEIKQRAGWVYTQFEFGDEVLHYTHRTMTATRARAISYAAIELEERSTLVRQNLWFLILGIALFMVGGVMLLSGMGLQSLELLIAGTLIAIWGFRKTRYVLIEVDRSEPILILADSDFDEIMKELSNRRKDLWRKLYADYDPMADPRDELRKFEWLLERKVISPEDFEWVRSEIEMSQRSFEPDDLN